MGLLLMAMAVIQWTSRSQEQHLGRPPHLKGVLPTNLPGWRVADEQIGETEIIRRSIAAQLSYDEAVYRSFRRGNDYFTIYIAYWGRGKTPARIVASHTPDRCFTLSGMRCIMMKFNHSLAEFGAINTQAEWRLFEDHDKQHTYVIFWHRVGGQLYDYNSQFNAIPNLKSWIRDAFQQAVAGTPEQYFIRITSNRPMEYLKADDGFRAIIAQACQVGV